MRTWSTFFFMSAVLGTLSACGGDDSGGNAAGSGSASMAGSGSGAGDGAAGSDAPDAISTTIRLTDPTNGGLVGSGGAPQQGVEVCVRGTNDCWTTDEQGEFTLETTQKEIDDENALIGKKDGYQTLITPMAPLNYIDKPEYRVIFPQAFVDAAVDLAGATGTADEVGTLLVQTFRRSADGMSISGYGDNVGIELTSGTGDGPHYPGLGFTTFDPEATATQLDGNAFAVLVDVEPGEVEITATGENCEPWGAWGDWGVPSDQSTGRAPVEAGALTYVSFVCD